MAYKCTYALRWIERLIDSDHRLVANFLLQIKSLPAVAEMNYNSSKLPNKVATCNYLRFSSVLEGIQFPIQGSGTRPNLLGDVIFILPACLTNACNLY